MASVSRLGTETGGSRYLMASIANCQASFSKNPFQKQEAGSDRAGCIYHVIQNTVYGSERTQWRKGFVVKYKKPSLIPWTHMIGENQLLQAVS